MGTLQIVAFVVFFSANVIASGKDYDKKLKDDMAQLAKERGIDPENMKPGQVYMSTPVMTEEEQGSRQMPKRYRCDGCRAVSYQFEKGFALAERKLKKGLRLPYSDVLEVAEHICDRTLTGYGIKSVNGQKFLSGEGLKMDKEMGMMEYGGAWGVRLQGICAQLIETYEEEEIYNLYVRRGDKPLAIGLCPYYCSKEEIGKLRSGRDEL